MVCTRAIDKLKQRALLSVNVFSICRHGTLGFSANLIHWISHVGHVRLKPDCYFETDLCGLLHFSCFRGNAHDCADVRVTRQSNGVIMKHSTRKSTLFEPIIVPRNIIALCTGGSADVSRSMEAILFETGPCHENVMWSAPSEELNGGAFTKALCGNFREGF